jgi:hypothetical protein
MAGSVVNDPSPKWRVHRSSRDHVDSCSGKRCHLPRSGSRQGHLLCRFSQTVYSARKLSTKLPVALVQKRG